MWGQSRERHPRKELKTSVLADQNSLLKGEIPTLVNPWRDQRRQGLEEAGTAGTRESGEWRRTKPPARKSLANSSKWIDWENLRGGNWWAICVSNFPQANLFARSDKSSAYPSFSLWYNRWLHTVSILHQSTYSFSSTVPLQLGPLTEGRVFLVSPNPINLLGRDLLCN